MGLTRLVGERHAIAGRHAQHARLVPVGAAQACDGDVGVGPCLREQREESCEPDHDGDERVLGHAGIVGAGPRRRISAPIN